MKSSPQKGCLSGLPLAVNLYYWCVTMFHRLVHINQLAITMITVTNVVTVYLILQLIPSRLILTEQLVVVNKLMTN